MTSNHWQLLYNAYKVNPDIFKDLDFSQAITFHGVEGDVNQPHWHIKEQLGDYKFDFIRTMSGKKLTFSDDLGLVGLSSIDLNYSHCYLTEGVSDFIAVKIMSTQKNVLGLTKLSGSSEARKILVALFDLFTIFGDNDLSVEGKQVNTGVTNMSRLSKFLREHNKKVRIIIPAGGHKDMAEVFVMKQNF